MLPEGGEDTAMRNPDRPSEMNLGHVPEVEDDTVERKRLHKITDHEKWEIKQVLYPAMHAQRFIALFSPLKQSCSVHGSCS